MEEQNRFNKVKQLSKAKRAQLDEKSAAQKAKKNKAEENQEALRPRDPQPAERLRSDDHGSDAPSHREDDRISTFSASSEGDAAKLIVPRGGQSLMTNSLHQSHEAHYEDGDLKLLVSAFSDAAEAGRWYAVLVDLSEPHAKIQRDQRAAMRFEDLQLMAQEMLDDYVRCHQKTLKPLEWDVRSK
jgi:hypothetical protein